MLTEDSDSCIYKRILAEFNASLFRMAPSLSNNFLADDGDYDSEVEKFKRDMCARSSTEDTTDVGISRMSSTFLSSPTAPHQLDHHVSVSVTSHVLHTIATSSQVLNIINSSISLSTERKAREPSPPIQVAAQPLPTKKGTKSSTDTARTQNKKSNQDITPAEPPTRVLRKCT